ncbi:unnamed protein product [Protopolystoma xenopodis]|uniref:Uncharacterized protein n=1 Tax=Protopolystoma xenopodis TaxID=117903 RepID=A0A3S4ZPR8_9PLAT|nr:unnamed protein product [Protopolystoma xenopodis]
MLPIPIGESLPGSHSGPLVSLPFHLHPPHRYNQSGDLASLPRPPGKDHDLPSNMIQLSVSSRLPFSNVPPLVSSQSQIAHFSLSDSPQSQNHHVSHHQQSKQSLPLQQKQISLPHDQISHQFRCFGSADEPSCSFVGTNASINLCSTGNTLSLNKTSQNLASVQPQPQALHLSLGQPPAASKERNLAEHDPAAFVRLLTERLQRLTCSDPNVIPSFSPNKVPWPFATSLFLS